MRSVLKPALDRSLRRRDPLIWPLPRFAALVRAMTTSLLQAGVNLRWRGVSLGAPRRYDHHLCHAAAACWASPFEEAACAVVDGFGEWTSTAFFHYAQGRLRRLGKIGFRGSWRRGSLGMYYAMLCALCGFDPVQGEEWKVMGLASYGEVDRELYRRLRSFLRVEGLELLIDGSPAQYRRRLNELRSLEVEAADLARTGQQVFADLMRELLLNLHARQPSANLALSGGCALNSAWNGKICEATPFRRLYVPSAPADDGCAVGAALLAYYEDHPPTPATPRTPEPLPRYAGRAQRTRQAAALRRLATRLSLAR